MSERDYYEDALEDYFSFNTGSYFTHSFGKVLSDDQRSCRSVPETSRYAEFQGTGVCPE